MCSYNLWLDTTSISNTVVYHGAQGAAVHFPYAGTLTPGVSFTPRPEVFATLTYATQSDSALPSPAFVLTTTSQDRFYFATNGQLRVIESAQGHRQRLHYTTVGSQWRLDRVESVQDPSKAIFFTYTNNALTTIRDYTTRAITLSYDPTNGDLTTIWNVMGEPETITYTNHLITARADSRNRLIETVDYTGIPPVGQPSLATPLVASTASRFKQVNGTLVADQTTAIEYRLDQRILRYTDANATELSVRTDQYTLDNTLKTQWLNGVEQRTQQLSSNLIPTERRDALGRATTQTSNSKGQITRLTNPLQQTMRITYTSDWRPSVVSDPLNHRMTMTYDAAGNLTRQTAAITTLLPLGRTTVYTYNVRYPGKNWLEESLSVDKLVTWYAYNANGLVTTEISAYNTPFAQTTTYTYDALGRVTHTTINAGTPAALTTQTVYRADGKVARTIRNPTGAPGSPQTATQNITTEYGYDAAGRRIWTKLPDGSYQDYTAYDSTGSVRWVVRNPINSAGIPTLPTDDTTPPPFYPAFPIGNGVTAYTYDALGRVVATTESGIVTGTLNLTTKQWSGVTDRTTTIAYDSLSRPVTTTVNYRPTINNGQFTPLYPDVNVPTYTYYDAVGNPVWQKDAFHHWTKTEYDALNRPVTVTLNYENGNPATIDSANLSWASLNDTDIIHVTRYNQFGVAQTIANYDPQTTGTWSATAPITNLVSLTHYNTLGMVIGTTRNSAPGVTGRTDVNLTAATQYDLTTGRMLGSQDSRGQWSVPTYDVLGRTITTTTNCRQGSTPTFTTCGSPAGSSSGTIDRNVPSAVTAYDAAGRGYQTTTPNGVVNRTIYDVLGRPIQQIRNYYANPTGTEVGPVNVSTATTYHDAGGRRWSTTDPTNAVTTYQANALGQTNVVTDAAGLVTRYGYDGSGMQRWVQYPSGRVDVTLVDGLGRTVKAIQNYHNGSYDPGVDPTDRDLITTSQYDGTGNLVATGDPAGRITSFRYDLQGRLVQVVENDTPTCSGTASDCRVTTVYRYDRAGNRTAIVDAKNNTRTMTYDAANRLISDTDAMQRTITYAYTREGLVTETIGHGSGTNRPIIRATYDEVGRQRTRTGAPTTVAAATVTQEWTYDVLGRTTTAYDSSAVDLTQQRTGIKTYSFDALNRVTNEQRSVVGDPAGNSVAMPFTYDAAGRVTQANSVGYTYDAAGRPWQVVQNNTVLAATSYDTAGRPATLTRTANGMTRMTTTYGYDGVDRQTSIQTIGATGTNATPTATLATWTYAYDRVNQPSTITSSERVNATTTINLQKTFTYDGVGRLTQEQAVQGTTTRTGTYTYDRVGNRTGNTQTSVTGGISGVDLQSTQYDASNRITTINGKGNAATYDGFGNLLTLPNSTAANTYDGLNRLSSSGTTSYRYHGETPVLQLTNGTATQAMLHNTVTGRTSTLLQITSLTQAQTSTAYRYDLTGQVLAGDYIVSGTTTRKWTLTDGQSTLRMLIDATSSTTTRQDLNAWGNPVTSRIDPLGFTGELTDATSGLVYLRARWYNPRTGTFLSRDPFDGYAELPLSMHPYQYGYNSPTVYTDPTGRDACDLFAYSFDTAKYLACRLTLQFADDMTVAYQDSMPSVGNNCGFLMTAGDIGLADQCLVDQINLAIGAHLFLAHPLTRKWISIGLDVTPVVGDAKGIVEAFLGCDIVTGESLGNLRWLGLLGVIGLGGESKVVANLPDILKATDPSILARIDEAIATGSTVNDRALRQLMTSDEQRRLRGMLLEGETAKDLYNSGFSILEFNKKFTFEQHGLEAELDIEVQDALIEVTRKDAGKLDQLTNRYDTPIMNPGNKPIILYAPKYGYRAGRDVEAAGYFLARTMDELKALLRK